MSTNGYNRTLLSLVLISSFSLSAEAASQCKGMEASACQQSEECTWVSSYTTKHGVTVSAYCRAASGKAKKSVKKELQQKDDKTSFNFSANPKGLQNKAKEEISG